MEWLHQIRFTIPPYQIIYFNYCHLTERRYKDKVIQFGFEKRGKRILNKARGILNSLLVIAVTKTGKAINGNFGKIRSLSESAGQWKWNAENLCYHTIKHCVIIYTCVVTAKLHEVSFNWRMQEPTTSFVLAGANTAANRLIASPISFSKAHTYKQLWYSCAWCH